MGVGVSELLAAAARALNAPEAIVKRSAEARAKATGMSFDEVLAAWAGGQEARGPELTGAEAAVPSPESQAPGPKPQTTVPTEEPAHTGVEPQPAGLEAVAAGPRAVTQPPPAPAVVGPAEALRFPVVVTVPTAGLAERTFARLPRWIAAVFFVVPFFGLFYLASAASTECGEGGTLLADRISGAVVDCDGSPFEGRQLPGGEVDYIATGESVYLGREIVAVNCGGCHGAQGQGGVGPAFAGIISTFGSCTDHIEWVSKGTTGFQAEGRATYGDLGKTVGGVGNMPEFASQLSPEQLASVVAFERVRFGNADPAATLADCGLVEAGEEGETTTAPAEGDTTTAPAGETTTTAPPA